jgi:hypothetical protein
LGVVPKSYLPNYSEFYERRHFAPAPRGNGAMVLGENACPFGTDLLFCCKNFPDFVLGVEICEICGRRGPRPPARSRRGDGSRKPVRQQRDRNESRLPALFGRFRFRAADLRLRLLRWGGRESTTDLVFAALI